MSNPIRKLQAFTQNVCLSLCEVPEDQKTHRCCDAIFCRLTEMSFPPDVKYEPTGHEITFMGKHGCIVKPEHRPFCTGYLCPGIADKYPHIWKEYVKLCEKAGIPHNKRKSLMD